MHFLKYILCFLLVTSIKGQIPDKLDIEEAEQRFENVEASKTEEKPEDKVDEKETKPEVKVDEDVPARVVLDIDNFSTYVQLGYTFVKFYAPWCPHCVQMAPDWNDLANHFQKNPLEGANLVIGDVDCTNPQAAVVCGQEGIGGYPTIKLYKDGAVFKDYENDRDFEAMKHFIISEIKGLDIETNEVGVHSLNDFTFKKFIRDAGEETPVVVKFYAPWCPACIAMEQTYNELASRFLDIEMEDVLFAQVNCVDQNSVQVCAEESVEDFPSIYLYKDGQLEDIYSGDSLKDMVNFVWETVDSTQVEEDDAFGNFGEIFQTIAMKGMKGGESNEDSEEENDEEEDDEEEEGEEDEEEGESNEDSEEENDEEEDDEEEEGEEDEEEGEEGDYEDEEEEEEEESEEEGETDNEESDSGDNNKDNKDSIEKETVSTSETKSEPPIPEHTEL